MLSVLLIDADLASLVRVSNCERCKVNFILASNFLAPQEYESCAFLQNTSRSLIELEKFCLYVAWKEFAENKCLLQMYSQSKLNIICETNTVREVHCPGFNLYHWLMPRLEFMHHLVIKEYFATNPLQIGFSA